VRVVRLHYYLAVRSYLSWLIYQLVILFKILRREDRDNIHITDPHSLALISGPRTNTNMSSRHFPLSCIVSIPDEEFEVLSEEDLTLLSIRFEHMYTNQKNARWSSGMCYR
jgi:hypothetical protein